MPGRKRINIYIDEDVWKQAKHICVDRGVSFSDLVEELLVEYLEKQGKGKG
ncbi:MAG: type II toxin-antitoxin system CcdA family antitoxin [Actinobacteria bacterium]|nr:type II toxin-antitoxin system CcdA family antitoxin [Actinomycetota bacterium]